MSYLEETGWRFTLEFPEHEERKLALKEQVGSFENSLLIDAWFDKVSEKVVMYFYDVKNNCILTSFEKPEHYCICRNPSKEEVEKKVESLSSFKRVQSVRLMDLLDDKKKFFTKVIVENYKQVKDERDSLLKRLPDALEVKMKPHLRFLQDKGLVPGTFYRRDGKVLSAIDPGLSDEARIAIEKLTSGKDEDYKAAFEGWMKILTPSLPDFKEVALDIEVQAKQNVFPDVKKAENKVLSISFVTSDGKNEVFLSKDVLPTDRGKNENIPNNLIVKVFENEKDLLRETFKICNEYPIVLTFNGDMFDMRYIANRASVLGLDRECPIIVEKGAGLSDFTCRLKSSIHLDLFQFFRNKAVQMHGFKGAYSENSLEAVAQGLLKEGKVGHGEFVASMSFEDLIYYNWKDSDLTYKLVHFNNGVAMALLVMMMRITKLPMVEMTRVFLSAWGKQMLFWEHKRLKCIIPNPHEIQIAKSSGHVAPKTRDSKYQGGLVRDPIPGIHFDVSVADFSSLYPSIMKEYNLSYETINCNHPECKENKIPGTSNHYCGKRTGLLSGVISMIRDIRVGYFKDKANDKSLEETLRAFFNVIQLALKVIMNSAYGMFGSEMFVLYCLPVADSITAVGRNGVMSVSKRCESFSVVVLYGDTDSAFLLKVTKEFIDDLSKWAQENLRLELALDKHYKFLCLSSRKKNYLGVYDDGKIDMKGLVGKKTNTPKFIRAAFKEAVDIVKSLKDEEDIPRMKMDLEKCILGYSKKLREGKLSLEDYEIRVKLQKDAIDKINSKAKQKTRVQHIVAAKELMAVKKVDIVPGTAFPYVKVKTGARALELASLREINKEKYKDMFRSAFEQILDALNMKFPEGNMALDNFLKSGPS